jgi:hypothetical protein
MEARYIGLPGCTAATLANCRTGNAARNTERTPGINNHDVNLFKNIKLSEGFSLEVGTEFYNVLNHPQYGVPSVSPFTPAGGAPATNVTGSAQGRFLRYEFMDGGGRVIRYNLTLRF